MTFSSAAQDGTSCEGIPGTTGSTSTRSGRAAPHPARDVILDFRHGDKVDLSSIDARTQASGNQSFRIVSDFTGSAGQLTWDKSGSGFLVSGDVNGDGNADFSIQVNTTLSVLRSYDFKL